MAEPQRPFVPHRTPAHPRPALGAASEFRLSKPFVPGTESEGSQPLQAEERDTISARDTEPLRGIDEFLQREAVAVKQSAPVAVEEYSESEFEPPEELPPVEHFLDPLPPVTEFTADEFPEYGAGERQTSGDAEPAGVEAEWIETDWQNFDWRAAAALGETGASEASNAWSTTDWDAQSPHPKPSRQTAAHAFAKALDEIAQRIRDGDLTVPAPGTVTDPATIAATLAALLGIRQ
jgi:hypothetical protein